MVLESRVDARKGAYDRVVKRLRDGLLKDKDINSTEGYLLLAIAAKQIGNQEDYDKAVKVARSNGSDVSALTGR